MKNVKFWLAQIAMVAIVSLVAGSPIFAGGVNNGNASDNGKANASTMAGGEGGEVTRGHVGSHSSGGGKGGGKGGGNNTGGSGDPVCSSSNLDLCTTEAECEDPAVGGSWIFGSICA